jgi:hypothetical protein
MKNSHKQPRRQEAKPASTRQEPVCATAKSKKWGWLDQQNLRWLPFFWTALFCIAAAWGMLSREQDLLYRISELNLFLPTPLFFKQYMIVPGGLMSYLGAFLTQFCYIPWLGTLLALLTWVLLILVARKAFSISDRWSVLLLVPAAMLLCAQMDQGYLIYYQKLKGFFFANTCGVLYAMSAVWLYRNLTNRYGARLICMFLCTAVGYPLFGAYGMLGTLWMALWNWKSYATEKQTEVKLKLPNGATVDGTKMVREHLRGKIMDTVMAVLIVIIVPVAWYQYYEQTGLSFLYVAGLPNYHINDKSLEYYRIPFYVLFLFPIIPFLLHKNANADAEQTKGKKVLTGHRKTAGYVLAQLVLAAAIGLTVCHFWYTDGNFHKELAMNRCIENCDWEGVLNIARDEKETPSRLMVMNKNLALFRLGRAGDEMYHYLDGGRKEDAPFDIRMMQVGGKELYFHYGKLNFCYRWCMEDGVEFGWKADYIKFLVKTSLMNGETKLARKYLNTLKQTLFFRPWAEQQEKFLRHPSLLKKDKEYGPVFHMLDYRDQLDGDNALVEMYLLATFAHADSNDPYFQEETLLSAMNMKDIALFWPRFNKYAIMHKGKRMPIHYQEAAYLYGNLEHKVDISHMPFDKGVVQRYKDFVAFSQQCQGMSEEQMKEAFYPMFGNTFYYFYFLIRNVKSF